jgi:site-specific recombinase XerD
MSAEQLPLFGDEQSQGASGPQVRQRAELRADSSLSAAMEQFHNYMVQQEYADNTIKSFLGDLKILKRYLQGNPAIAQIGTSDLKRFLHWLQHERGRPCSTKSYARRLTTLKVFFGWLAHSGILPVDPATPLPHKPVQTPLPRILYDHQIEQVLAVTREMMSGGQDKKPDPRPHLLVHLLLSTGIKKQECMAIRLAHLDSTNPDGPVLHIRYERPRMQYKERRLRLPEGWTNVLDQYLRIYEPQQVLFPCTARNLEYVLSNVAKRAGLEDGLSFEMLRWTCAVRDYRAGMDQDRLQRKLGLSSMSWRETEPKLARLAEPPL